MSKYNPKIKHFDLITLGVDRKEVEDNDISNIERILADTLKRGSDEVRHLKGRFSIAVSGYDKDKRELFQIEEFKKWAGKLALNNPECIYYFDTKSVKLLIAACLDAKSVQSGVMYIDPLLLKEFLNTNLNETRQLMHNIVFSEEEFKEFEREIYLKFGLS